MNNQRNLYIIISVLVLMNIITLSYMWGGLGVKTMMFGNGHWAEMQEHMGGNHEEVSLMQKKVNYDKPVAETHKSNYDFGSIGKFDGVVSTTFEIENHGKEILKIGSISTSCGCTSAEIDKTELGFNEEAELTVYFDPNFHEESEGAFTRSIFVETNDPDLSEMQFDIRVEIVE